MPWGKARRGRCCGLADSLIRRLISATTASEAGNSSRAAASALSQRVAPWPPKPIACVGSIQATPEVLNDPAAFQKFQAAQGELSSALSRLLVVTENYPQLKADGVFRDLQAQLEGTENRITVARNRYIKSVQEYNVTVRSFPSNLTAMLFGHQTKANFPVENEKALAKPPTVDSGGGK